MDSFFFNGQTTITVSLALTKQYIADLIKVALGIGIWALGICCFVVTQANDCIVLYAQLPKQPLLI